MGRAAVPAAAGQGPAEARIGVTDLHTAHHAVSTPVAGLIEVAEHAVRAARVMTRTESEAANTAQRTEQATKEGAASTRQAEHTQRQARSTSQRQPLHMRLGSEQWGSRSEPPTPTTHHTAPTTKLD